MQIQRAFLTVVLLIGVVPVLALPPSGQAPVANMMVGDGNDDGNDETPTPAPVYVSADLQEFRVQLVSCVADMEQALTTILDPDAPWAQFEQAGPMLHGLDAERLEEVKDHLIDIGRLRHVLGTHSRDAETGQDALWPPALIHAQSVEGLVDQAAAPQDLDFRIQVLFPDLVYDHPGRGARCQ